MTGTIHAALTEELGINPATPDTHPDAGPNTFTTWRDLPAGTRGHHHCVALPELAHDLARWTDPTTRPYVVARTATAATVWIHDRLTEALTHTHPDSGDHTQIREWLDSYDPHTAPAAGITASFWQRHVNTLTHGHWAIQPVFTRPGPARTSPDGTRYRYGYHKLVLYLLCYPDSDPACAGHPPTTTETKGNREWRELRDQHPEDPATDGHIGGAA